MKIAIISDTHDNIQNVEKVIEILNSEKVIATFHCGDIISPFTLKKFSNLKSKIYIVFGNNDGDKIALLKNKPKNAEFFNLIGEVEIKGRKILFTHYDIIAYAFAFTKKYDFIFYGHTHKAEVKKIGKTILINPGELAGYLNKPSYAILNLKNKKVEIRNL